ncbi:MAG: hypothetical protein K5770_08025 [Lachnospiraceae bacterium]|nr:hypothetical protein [Lachnospiraceae bacterium]
MKKTLLTVIICLMSLLVLAGFKKGSDASTGSKKGSAKSSADSTADDRDGNKKSDKKKDKKDSKKDDETDYDAVYAPVLTEVVNAIKDGYDYDKEYDYVLNGLMEEIMYGEPDELLESIGYVIMDINDDGVPELLIGKDETFGGDKDDMRSNILNGYSVKDGKPLCFLDGWVRSSHQWMGNGHIFYFGSSGAASSAFGEAHLNKAGDQLEWDDFYFTEGKENGKTGLYHNTIGYWEIEKSEELKMSEDAFWDLMDDYEFELLDWTPVGEYKGNGSAVSAAWAEDVYDKSVKYIKYEPEDSTDYTAHVIFSVDKKVKNFRIVELTVKNIDDDGNIEFLYEECFKKSSLKPNKPVYAGLNFMGSIPNNGFMYTDEDGNDRLFVLEESGKDGSLVVWEYK